MTEALPVLQAAGILIHAVGGGFLATLAISGLSLALVLIAMRR